MIPKQIHYCWFGQAKKPSKIQKCIESWTKNNPDFEIIEWNESNFDVHANRYLEWCFENEKWAYLSDLARLIIVYENGGFYFDTDVELIRTINPLTDYDSFFCFETNDYVASGLGFGSEKNSEILKLLIDEYTKQFLRNDCEIIPIGCPIMNTRALVQEGLKLNGSFQYIRNTAILPAEYFNPYDDPTGKLNITKNTYGIHWYFKSALSKSQKIRSIATRPFHRLMGVDCFRWLKRKC